MPSARFSSLPAHQEHQQRGTCSSIRWRWSHHELMLHATNSHLHEAHEQHLNPAHVNHPSQAELGIATVIYITNNITNPDVVVSLSRCLPSWYQLWHRGSDEQLRASNNAWLANLSQCIPSQHIASFRPMKTYGIRAWIVQHKS